jgi:hypothetical protein
MLLIKSSCKNRRQLTLLKFHSDATEFACHYFYSEFKHDAERKGELLRSRIVLVATIRNSKEFAVKTLLLASVALAFVATPALAKPGHGHGNAHAAMSHDGHGGHSTLSARVDGNRNGILDRRERGFRDRDRDGRDDRFESNRYGANNCPPGLAKKNNGCMAPGQAARLFRQGQRVPNGYNYYTDYSNIPVQYRNQYNLDTSNRYIYRNDNIYVVNPRTSLVERIISSL